MSAPLIPVEQPVWRSAVALLVGACDGSAQSGLVPALRALAAVGVRPATAVTAVRPFTLLDRGTVVAQVRASLGAHPVDAIHVGDPGHADHAAALAEVLAEVAPLVLDPELVDARGGPRHPRAVGVAVLERLCPQADLLVVNTSEAALLTARPAEDLAALREAGKRLADTGVRHVQLCGGRLEGHAVDLLYDGRDFLELGADRAPAAALRGQGATLSAAVCGHLARGMPLLQAVHEAKRLTTSAILGAVGVGSRLLTEPLVEAWEAQGIDGEPLEVSLESE